MGHVTKDLVQEMIDLEPVQPSSSRKSMEKPCGKVEAGLLLFSITAVANVLCLPSFGLWIGAGVWGLGSEHIPIPRSRESLGTLEDLNRLACSAHSARRFWMKRLPSILERPSKQLHGLESPLGLRWSSCTSTMRMSLRVLWQARNQP